MVAVIGEDQFLAVTVANNSDADYSGPLVISVSGVPVAEEQKVFPVDLAGHAAATLNFPLSGDIDPEGGSALVRIDPSNLIEEASEDNNETTFIVTPPVDPPQISLTPQFLPNAIEVTIANSGGTLDEPNASLSLTLGDTTTVVPVQLLLENGENVVQQVPRFFTNDSPYTLELLAGSNVIASVTFPNPSATPTVESETPTEETGTPES